MPPNPGFVLFCVINLQGNSCNPQHIAAGLALLSNIRASGRQRAGFAAWLDGVVSSKCDNLRGQVRIIFSPACHFDAPDASSYGLNMCCRWLALHRRALLAFLSSANSIWRPQWLARSERQNRFLGPTSMLRQMSRCSYVSFR